MRFVKGLMAGLIMVLLASTGASAGSDLNEVGAALVFPAIVALEGPAAPVIYESYATITNASENPVTAHISFINGDSTDAANYCDECDTSIALTGNDTEMLIIRWDPIAGVVIETEPDGAGTNAVQLSCDWQYGMLVVTLEDGVNGPTVTDNVLLGEQVVVNYTDGYAFSIPAVPFQGVNGTNGDKKFGFDDIEYGKFPRIVAADFIAPDPGAEAATLKAQLILFTLNFMRDNPPLTDCSVTGFDADENSFSRSIQFGCWEFFHLEEISPEFNQPNLGLFAQGDTHGWLQLVCEVDGTDDGVLNAVDGGVHGAIVQRMEGGAVVRRNDPNAPDTPANEAAAFGRLLYQSVTTGDPTTLTLVAAP